MGRPPFDLILSNNPGGPRLIGKSLAHYEVTALLGKGGMGEVYRANDTKLGREVALKLLPPGLAEDAERLARFRREARTLASLHNAHIASLFGIEEIEGTTILVMELVEGQDLSERLAASGAFGRRRRDLGGHPDRGRSRVCP